MTLRSRLGLLAIALVFSVSNAQANDFARFFSAFESLSADFHQVLLDAQNRQLESSQGKLIFVRPGRLRWQTTNPSQQVLLLNEQQLYLIDHELEQVSQRSLETMDNTPIYWLARSPETLEVLPEYSHSHQDIDWYRASEQLSFGFQAGRLHAIRHTNALEQTVLVRLDNLLIDPEVDPQQLQPSIPAGFDLIKLF